MQRSTTQQGGGMSCPCLQQCGVVLVRKVHLRRLQTVWSHLGSIPKVIKLQKEQVSGHQGGGGKQWVWLRKCSAAVPWAGLLTMVMSHESTHVIKSHTVKYTHTVSASEMDEISSGWWVGWISVSWLWQYTLALQDVAIGETGWVNYESQLPNSLM